MNKIVTTPTKALAQCDGHKKYSRFRNLMWRIEMYKLSGVEKDIEDEVHHGRYTSHPPKYVRETSLTRIDVTTRAGPVFVEMAYDSLSGECLMVMGVETPWTGTNIAGTTITRTRANVPQAQAVCHMLLENYPKPIPLPKPTGWDGGRCMYDEDTTVTSNTLDTGTSPTVDPTIGLYF